MADTPLNPYADKSLAYFTRARTEIEPLLPRDAAQTQRVLEIGCSEGHTLEWLKKSGRSTWTAGVEPFAEVHADARAIDAFFKLDIEKELPLVAAESVDVVLCLDVLEHLVDPWATLRRLDTLLKPGGLWIISVPNIRNYHILMDLAFKGKFEYSESGILDRTHLRFFTRDSAIAMAECTGAVVTQVMGTETTRWQKRLLNTLGLGELIAKQHIVAAKKPARPH